MAYYDGNTVTALWNYAQHCDERSFLRYYVWPIDARRPQSRLRSTNGVVNDGNAEGNMVSDGNGGYTLTRNAAPVNDICSATSGALIHMTGKNVGDLLNAAGVTWGFFHEGFDTSVININGTTGCRRSN